MNDDESKKILFVPSVRFVVIGEVEWRIHAVEKRSGRKNRGVFFGERKSAKRNMR